MTEARTAEHRRVLADLDRLYAATRDGTLAAVADLDYDTRKKRLWEMYDEARSAFFALGREQWDDEEARAQEAGRLHAVYVGRAAAEIINSARTAQVGSRLRRQAGILMREGLESAFSNIDR